MSSLLTGFGQELRITIRELFRRPIFTVLVISTLAVGIGLNSSIFSLVNAVLLRPLAVSNPDRLVRIYGTAADGSRQNISYPDYIDFSEENRVFSGLSATHLLVGALEIGDHSQQVLAEAISNNYFEVLGVSAALGRTFRNSDRYDNNVVVMSHDLWERSFQSSQDIVGRTLILNRQIFTIAGVAPKSFHGTFGGAFPALWVPLIQTQGWLGPDWRTDRNALRLRVIGRLANGINMEEARSAIQIIARRLQQLYPDTNKERGANVEEAKLLPGGLRGMITVFLSLFLLIVGLVLLTVCANLANFVFIRALARRREFSVRLALGAGRLHLLRKTLAESMILSVAGGTTGLLVAAWCSKLFLRFNPIPSVPLRFDLEFDYRVYLFTLLTSAVSTCILTLPSLSLLRKTNPAENLKQEAGSLSAGQSRARLRKFFVTVQVAFSLLLLIGAALFLQSLQNAQSMDLGFIPENALALDLDLKTQDYSEEFGRNFYEQLIRKVKTLPGVVSASFSDLAPVDLATSRVGVVIGKQGESPGNPILISMNCIHYDYFRTIGKNLLSGRDFVAADRESSQPVAIINEHMAKRFWPNQSPIGQAFQVAVPEKKNSLLTVTIVGIAQNGKYRTLGELPQSHFYLPFLQNYQPAMTLLVRTTRESMAMMDNVQREIQNLNPNVQGFFPRTLIQHIGFSLLPARMAAVLSSIFAILALMLAAIGIYGIIAYSVAQRSREIGVRTALGASPRDVLRLFLNEGFRWTIWGLLCGCAATLAVMRLASNFLYSIGPADPITFLFGVLILVLLIISATYFPARRAAKTDPIVALRYE